jgi:hypothetical protein
MVETGSVVTAHAAASRIRRVVSCVVERSSLRNIMLMQEELAFLKSVSTLQLSPVILRGLRMAMSRRKKPVVLAGTRGTTSGGGARAFQRPSSQLAGKRKANELASSGDLSELANRRLALGPHLCPRPLQSRANKLLSAAGNSNPQRRGDVRGCSGRDRRPVSAKWVT